MESYDSNRVEVVHYLTPYIKTYGEVDVYNEKKIKALDKQREMLAIKVKNPAPKNTIIGRLYSASSKKERNKRKVALLDFEYEQKYIILNYLYICFNSGWIALENDEVDSFIYSLELDLFRLKHSSNYELFEYLKSEAEKWKKNKRN